MYVFHPLGEENLRDVVFLFKSVVRKRVTTAYLRRKYLTPWGHGRMWGFIAYTEADKRPVAMAAALICLIRDGDRQIRAAQTMDTLTCAGHTGRGLMTELLRRTITTLKAQEVAVFFGFCNQNSRHAYVKKLGWQHLFNMECYLMPARTLPLEAISRRLRLDILWRYFGKKMLEKYKSPVRSFPNALTLEGFGGVLHDEAFFEYKTFTFNHIVELGGMLCWIKAQGGLLIGDVPFSPETDVDRLLQELRRLARRLGLRQVIFQVSPGTRLQQELSVRLRPRGSWAVVADAGESGLELAALRFDYGDVDTF